MIQILNTYQASTVHLNWKILKGSSQIPEDFSRVTLSLLLVTPSGDYQTGTHALPNDKIHLLDATADHTGIINATVPTELPTGIYSLKAIWVKDQYKYGLAEYKNAFAITDDPAQATPWTGTQLTIRIVSTAATYGYDGLNAYELALLDQVTTALSEKEYVQIRASEIETKQIADGAITTPKIADGAVTRDKIADGTITDLTSLYDTFQQQIAALTTQISEYEPIVINGDVTNAADEEDLTSSNGLLKLKNRNSLYGMGKIILRRNQSFAEQLTQTNTIYIIQYDFDLNGTTVTIPENCVLQFEGGKISNGTLIGHFTSINNFIYGEGLHLINFTQKVFRLSEFSSVFTYVNNRVDLSSVWTKLIDMLNSSWSNLRCQFIIDIPEVCVTEAINVPRGVSISSNCDATIYDTNLNEDDAVFILDNPDLDSTVVPSEPISRFTDYLAEASIKNLIFDFDGTPNEYKTVILDNMGTHSMENLRVVNLLLFDKLLKQPRNQGGYPRTYCDRQYYRQLNAYSGRNRASIILWGGDGRVFENSINPSLLCVGGDFVINGIIGGDITLINCRATINNWHSESCKVKIINSDVIFNSCVFGSNYNGYRENPVATVRINYVADLVEFEDDLSGYIADGALYSRVIFNNCSFSPKFSNTETYDIDVYRSNTCELTLNNTHKTVGYSAGEYSGLYSDCDVNTNYSEEDRVFTVNSYSIEEYSTNRFDGNKNIYGNNWNQVGTYTVNMTYFPLKGRSIYSSPGPQTFEINSADDKGKVFNCGFQGLSKEGFYLLQMMKPDGTLFYYIYKHKWSNAFMSSNIGTYGYHTSKIPFNSHSVAGGSWIKQDNAVVPFINTKNTAITYRTILLQTAGFTDRALNLSNVEAINKIDADKYKIVLKNDYTIDTQEIIPLCVGDIVSKGDDECIVIYSNGIDQIIFGATTLLDRRSRYIEYYDGVLTSRNYGQNRLRYKQIITGSSAQRPANPVIGFEYFDTTLNKPIYWTGTAWVDALGNPVDSVYPKVIGTPTTGNVAVFDGTDIEDGGAAPNVSEP